MDMDRRLAVEEYRVRIGAKQKRVKGETLIETIISFAVVLLTLTVLTTIVQLSIRMNNRSADNATELEVACSALESGVPGTIIDNNELVLVLPDSTKLTMPIVQCSNGVLSWFDALVTEVDS